MLGNPVEVESLHLYAARPNASGASTVAPAFDAPIKRAIEVERSRRFQTVAEFIGALRYAQSSSSDAVT